MDLLAVTKSKTVCNGASVLLLYKKVEAAGSGRKFEEPAVRENFFSKSPEQ